MHCVEQIWGVCFVVTGSGGEHSIFKFADFIAALALLVIVYTVSDVRYRFRLAIAPTIFHLYVETFSLIGVIGFGVLLTDIWQAQHWLVPESLITDSIWRGMFAALFLSLAMTWMWYAFIKPPIFCKKNAQRYASTLYSIVVRGSSEDFPVIANEVGRSAASLVKYSRQDLPAWERAQQKALKESQQGPPPKKQKSNSADIAHDVLLLLGSRKLCRHIVASSSVTAIAFFEAAGDQKKAGLPLGQFAKNISTEAILDKDSALYHEDEGYSAGLVGYLKPFSRAIYGDYPLIEDLGSHFGSPLDVQLGLKFDWDADQMKAYCGAVLITLENYLKVGRWGQNSFSLNRALGNLEFATNDLYLLDNTTSSFYSSDIAKRLRVAVEFMKNVVELFEKTVPFPQARLRASENIWNHTFYDKIADMMLDAIHNSSSVTEPFDTSWSIQHNMIWAEFFGLGQDGNAWKIVRFKLRRLLYDEILRMDKFINFKSARILGYCLNVMGLTVYRGEGSHGRDYRPLHQAVLAWVQRNYLRVLEANPEVARACLIGSISYDPSKASLVKTYAKGLEREPHREYLPLKGLQ